MSEKGLGTILANAEARMAELKPDPPVPEQQGRETLKAVALLFGHDSAKVLKNFDDGGTLADLVRTVLNIEQRQSGEVGRPLSDEAIATFLQYLLMARDGVSKRQVTRILADRDDKPEGTIKQRIKRGLDRTKGPKGIAELYSMIRKNDLGGT